MALSYKYVKNFINSRKDYKLISKTYKTSKTKIEILHKKCNKTFWTTFDFFKRSKEGCSHCKGLAISKGERFSYAKVKEFIEKNNYELISKEYKKNDIKLDMKCPKGHLFQTTYSQFQQSVKNKNRICSYCNKLVRLPYKEVKNIIEKRKYKLLTKTYINVNQKLKLKCPKGHIIYMTLTNFKSSQIACTFCRRKENGKKRRHSYEYVKEYIEKENYKLLSKKYINNLQKLKIKCPKNHIYKVKWNYFQQGKRCPFCVGGVKHTYKYVKKQIEKENYKLLSKNYKNNNQKLELKCPRGHTYITTWASFQIGVRCSKCFKSKGEAKVYAILEKYSILFEIQKRFKECRDKNPLPFDFYLPNQNTLIEFDGIYHYKPIFNRNNKELALKKFLNIQKHDEIKNKFALDNNLNLLRIDYVNFKNIEDIIKNKIVDMEFQNGI